MPFGASEKKTTNVESQTNDRYSTSIAHTTTTRAALLIEVLIAVPVKIYPVHSKMEVCRE